MTVKGRRPAVARLPQSLVALFLRTRRRSLVLLSGLACLSLCVAAPVRLQPNTSPVTSPLLLLERSIGQISEQPEFLSLLNNAGTTAKPPNPQGTTLPSLSSTLGTYDEENHNEVWEQRVRPPHLAVAPKPKDHQRQKDHQQQQQLLQESSAFGAQGLDAVSHTAASSHPHSTQQVPSADAAAATAADAAQVRQPGEVGGRYPLDSGHPPTGAAAHPQHRLLKPMRTIAYGNIHQTAYYFADLFVGAGAPQRQSLILDTGSSVMAFPCEHCRYECSLHLRG
ncbi:hypothetical protein Esti_002149 [Eimeria stiedai]